MPTPRKTPTKPEPQKHAETVLASVRRDLEVIRERDAALADSALAATALAMARAIDSPRNSATSKSMCAGKLVDVLKELRELTPPAKEADAVDDLRDRRNSRRRGLAAG